MATSTKVTGKDNPNYPDAQDSFWDFDESSLEVISTDFGKKWVPGEDDAKVGPWIFTGVTDGPDDEERGGKVQVYNFVNKTGDKFYTWGFYALREVVENESLNVGDLVVMEYVGSEPTKRGLNPVKKVEIKVKRR